MHISHFIFFANDLLLAVYFVFILDREMMLDKKQIWVMFLLEFKMGPKAVLTTRNINSAFGPGTSNELIVQWWLKMFCKGDESCEDMVQWPVIGSWQWTTESTFRSWPKLVQPLCRTVWRFPKKLEIELPYDPVIHCWAYTLRKPEVKETHVPQCSLQHCL